ncbi:MAG: outer membrane beta-barrel protein [Elusimicrobia bacterium]|nr:outer membrane beta-barrel protein [Elusimicrobiota bacterium]
MTGAALLALLCAAPAAAQVPYRPLFHVDGERVLGLALGMARPTASEGLSRAAAPGPSLGADFLRYYGDWTALGLGLDYHVLGKGADAGPPSVSAKATVAALSLLARVNLVQGETWTPYLTGGVGYGLTSLDVTATAAPGSAVCTDVSEAATCKAAASVSKSYSGVVVTGAAGFEDFVTQGLSLFLETRYQQFRLPLSSASFPMPQRRGETLAFRIGAHLWLGPSQP